MAQGRLREYIVRLDQDVRIRCRRSEELPYRYAFIHEKRTAGRWGACISADNSHASMHDHEHHYHEYRKGERLEAQPLPFPVADANDAMGKIEAWFKADWKELIA